MNKVTVKMDVRSAAAVRQVLFESQKDYGLEYVPERILDIRSVIEDIDASISEVVNSK
jgi:hypothetical protein